MNAFTGNPPGDEEEPLDPAVEKIRRRMARLMVISIGIMVVGLGAVFTAIFLKLNQATEGETTIATSAASPIPVPESANYIGKITLPAGAVIMSTSLSGSQVLLRLKLAAGEEKLWLYDIPTGRHFGSIDIEP